MREERTRVDILTNIPAPYRFPLFRALEEQPDISPRVIYTAANYANRKWVKPKGRGFTYRVLPGITLHLGTWFTSHPFYLDLNPTAALEFLVSDAEVLVVSGYSSLTCLVGYLLWKLRRRRVIMWGEGSLKDPTTLAKRGLRRLITFLFREADACIASSSGARELLLSYGAPEDRVFLSPLVADTSLFRRHSCLSPRVDSLHRKLDIEDGSVVVLYVGMLDRHKGVMDLVEAGGFLPEDCQVHLLMVGEGPLRRALVVRSRELGLRLSCVGYVYPEDLPEYYVLSDLFVLPSHSETFGLVVNEAVACGLPVVISDRVAAGDDLVVPGVNGLIFRAGDTRQLAALLKVLVSHPEKRAKMGAASLEIAEQWNIGRSVAGFLDAIACAANG